MNRPIKFRAWDKRAKAMLYSGFILDVMAQGTVVAWIENEDEPNEEYDKDTFPVTLLQFTGLHDKNGKEIWEGDVMRYNYHIDKHSEDFTGQVVFEDRILERQELPEHHVGFILKAYDAKVAKEWWYSSIPTVEDLEVIGNIYENPELLK